ncbi:hypothetical protein SAMN04488490_4318 [Marinobacter sp. LV10R510-11A]|uniref:hypothetical protein n=1 Tax=Marinobacter sp. LV10R510-11A TaxID=1415568 RepID=UPI000BB80DF6|nr:hypothetical protein [Marinobacter sp. LV10R510-11A]SOB78444.1 hypothetical protein SAMN04488490_4318 [Marinobacter sp. LV10R510-11A]
MRLNLGLLLFSSITLITACGFGDDAIDDVRNQPNSFSGSKNAVDDFSPGSTGDSGNNGGLASKEVRITMEVPGGLAPNGEPTRRNLRIVKPDQIRVYQTNSNLQDLGEPSISTRTDDNGFTVIEFQQGLPLAPDVIIEARYGNVTMRALAADADRDIKINPFSEYLVRNTITQYTSGEFQRIRDCAKETNNALCLNKYVWPTLADQVHDFEIDIPTGASVSSALDVLSDRADFANYVASMADYALLDDQSSGKISASSADYNSVFMGVELGQTFLENSFAQSGQWGVRLGREKQTGTSAQPAYLYPGLTLASFDIFNIKVTNLATQIPYDRKTLIHKRGNAFFTRGDDTWDLNTHSTSPGAATLDDDARLLAGRALYQSITGKNSARTIGWTRNPYFLDAYTSGASGPNTGPDRALAGYFSAGKAIELESERGKLKRKQELEAHYLSVLELNLLRQEGFDADTLNGRNYNTVYLATRFAETSTPMQVEAGTGDWQISSGSGNSTITQTFTTLSRDNTGAVSVNNAGNRSDSWIITPRTALLSTGDKNVGRLNLDVNNPAGQFGQPDLGVGASVPDGSLLAFNLTDAASTNDIIGDGLLIAAEKATSGAPSSGSYRVQGFVLGMKDGFNRLIHLDNGVLNLSGATASLDSATLEVLHSVDFETVSVPASGQVAANLAYTNAGDGQVSFSAGDLLLEGFVTADQSQFFLLYRDEVNGEERLGMLIATQLP